MTEIDHARRMADAIRASGFMPAYVDPPRRPDSLAETVANIRATRHTSGGQAYVDEVAAPRERPRPTLIVDNTV